MLGLPLEEEAVAAPLLVLVLICVDHTYIIVMSMCSANALGRIIE